MNPESSNFVIFENKINKQRNLKYGYFEIDSSFDLPHHHICIYHKARSFYTSRF